MYLFTRKPNRVLIHKLPRLRLVIPEEVVVQPCLTVAILVLQAEGLVSSSGYVGFTLRFTATIIIPKPNQVIFVTGYLSWDANLVTVEVVGLLAVFAVFVDVALIEVTAYICATHSMSGLKVLCRLRLAVINNRNWVVLNYIDIINITTLIYPFIPVIYYPLSIYSSKVIWFSLLWKFN